MNNIHKIKNQKMAGVFETQDAVDKFINRLKKLNKIFLSPNNCQIKKYKAIKDKKLISTTIKENDYIVVIEGKKEDLDRIGEEISLDRGRYLSSEQMNSFELTDDFLLELP